MDVNRGHEPERGHLGRFDHAGEGAVEIESQRCVLSTAKAGGTPARQFMEGARISSVSSFLKASYLAASRAATGTRPTARSELACWCDPLGEAVAARAPGASAAGW